MKLVISISLFIEIKLSDSLSELRVALQEVRKMHIWHFIIVGSRLRSLGRRLISVKHLLLRLLTF